MTDQGKRQKAKVESLKSGRNKAEESDRSLLSSLEPKCCISHLCRFYFHLDLMSK